MTSASGTLRKLQTCNDISQSNKHMSRSSETCDVIFQVGKEKKPVTAHRHVLISRSSVFYAMFYGPLAEKEDITIPDVSSEDFEAFVRYLYGEKPEVTPDNATTMLYLAKKYAVEGLERLSLDFLEGSLCPDTACDVLEQAHGFDEVGLHATDTTNDGEEWRGSPRLSGTSRSMPMLFP
ncbi:BTB/POZ domain-containing protein 6-A-like [Haliotis rubra]|uniref:BTB/POZ domain-containing protein 6-A-like n=1 Tax=Haliotis rubra TaxID=36100 RepID=UPI001EE598CD|nr:BTB/POZ domain-containing protein 6-A-like [Haliotis rubra]XP_046576786.1 BTB/POZ domain-containing protein 6-A-like [Haliotis rubra]XP_046576792.1 BTB/POZ domain-containing protein 6-A-like [Haliotis rubra]